MQTTVDSIEQMHQFGVKIGLELRVSDVVVLTGELGAGKTVLAQAIASALGITGITSPTFVISRIHQGKVNLIHIDAYRLLDHGRQAFTDLDFDSYLPNSVFVIEWGASFVTTLTDQYLEIVINQGQVEGSRDLVVNLVGQRWKGFAL